MQLFPSLCSTTPQLDGFQALQVALSATRQHQPIADRNDNLGQHRRSVSGD